MVGQDQLEGAGESPSHPQRQLEHQLGPRAQEPLHSLQHQRLALPPAVEYGVEVSEENPQRAEEEVDPGQETVASAPPHVSHLQTARGQPGGQNKGSGEATLQVVTLNMC